MFTHKNLKLDGIEDFLGEIRQLDEMKNAGEDQEDKYTKKSGKKSKDFDGDGDVEDETDEYAGVKDRAIKNATKEDEEDNKKKEKKESVDFSSVLDELTDEDLLFLSDDLIEEVVEEFFNETLEEGFEIDELESLLLERVESELKYLEEATVTVGHDSDVKPEASRTNKLAKVGNAIRSIASGAKKVAKKVAGAAGEVAGSAVAGYQNSKSSAADDQNQTDNTTSQRSSSRASAKGTNRPGILGKIGSALKSGLKNAIRGTGKIAGKVVKTAKDGYDEGRGKSAPVAKPASPTVKPAAKKPVAKPMSKSKGNLDKLLQDIRSEAMENPCWKGYEMIGTKNKNGKKVPNCVPKEEYEELVRDMIEEGYDSYQIRQVIEAYEDEMEVIFEEDGVVISNTQEFLDEEQDLDEEAQFLSDVEIVADWLHAEGVIENEDQFFGLMEDMTEEEIEELYSVVLEATAMTKRGYDEAPIRNKIAKATGGGKTADKATALADRGTYGNKEKKAGRENLARKQRGDFRNTTSSSPGLRGYGHQSSDPAVKAKQSARGAQRGVLTPNEKKNLGREGYEMIGNSLEEGGLEVRNYSWKEVMESQYARNNPEKYEADQKKKSAPVRGEKTPMPPRGDKRREDFEKWYAANVR